MGPILIVFAIFSVLALIGVWKKKEAPKRTRDLWLLSAAFVLCFGFGFDWLMSGANAPQAQTVGQSAQGSNTQKTLVTGANSGQPEAQTTSGAVSAYVNGLQANVIPFISSIGSTYSAIGSDIQAGDIQSAAADAVSLQSEVEAFNSGLQELQPPPHDLAQVNALFEKMSFSLTKAANLATRGVKDQSAGELSSSEAYLSQATAYGQQAVQAFEAWKQQNGGS